MAKKSTSKKSKLAPTFSIGDLVEVLHFGKGKITELRGPLGPGGASVYRVMYRRKPTVGYLEVLGSQLRPAKTKKHPKPTVGDPPTPNMSGGAIT